MKLDVLYVSDEKSLETHRQHLSMQTEAIKEEVGSSFGKEYVVEYGESPTFVLQKAVDYAKSKRHKLLISNFSSFSSDLIGLRYLHDKGIDFEFFDFEAAQPENMDSIIATLQYLSTAKGAKIKRGLELRKAQGYTLGNPNNFTSEVRLKAIASRTDNALADEHNQKATSKILELKKKGFSYGKIANRLNELGYRTRYGKRFFAISVSRLYKRAVQLEGNQVSDDEESADRFQPLLYLERKVELQAEGDAKRSSSGKGKKVKNKAAYNLGSRITLKFFDAPEEEAKLHVENAADRKAGVKREFEVAADAAKLIVKGISDVGLYYWRLVVDGEAIQFGKFTVE